MQRLGGGGYTRKNKRGGGNDPSCGCDMQAGWPKFLTENIPLPTGQAGGGTCGAPPIPRFYQGGGGCGLLPPQAGGSQVRDTRLSASSRRAGLAITTGQRGGGNLAGYNSNPVPDACPFPGTGYCGFYARGGGCGCGLKGGANYGEPLYLQAKLRGGYRPTKKNRAALKKWRKGKSIGFTMRSSLKAKGLIPRTSKKHRGKKMVSAKYQ
jgi:hypothetical protein